MVAVQLRNFTAKGKLMKVKASFKLADAQPAKDKKVVKKTPAAPLKCKATADAIVTAAKKKKPAALVSLKAVKSPKIKKVVAKKSKKVVLVKPKQPKSVKTPILLESSRMGVKRRIKNSTSSPVKCYFVQTESSWTMDKDKPYVLHNKSLKEARSTFMHVHTTSSLGKYMARLIT